MNYQNFTPQYITYHKIIDFMESVQQASPRLKSFGHGDIVYFSQTLTGGTATYPYMFVTPMNISYAENTTQYQLNIIFGDIVNTDLSNEVDVVSDMSLEARNLLSQIWRGSLFNDVADVQLPTSATPFLERFNDHIGGVSLDLIITVMEDMNACPMYDLPAPTETPISETPTPTPTTTITPTPTETPTPTPTPSQAAFTGFIMEIDTTKSGGSSNNTYVLGLNIAQTYNAIVDWGDGTSQTITGSSLSAITKTYSTPGVYDIKISGTFPSIRPAVGGDGRKVMKIKNWGNIVWRSLAFAFEGCSNMDITATDAPILTNITSRSLERMFRGCFSLTGNSSFNTWNISQITNIRQMFNFTAFNQNIGSWNLNTGMSGIGLDDMLSDSGMNTENYSRTLIGWANSVSANGNLPSGLFLGASPSTYNCINYVSGQTYNNAVDAHNYLSTSVWIITDGGQTGAPC
jgi:hypothetical protein